VRNRHGRCSLTEERQDTKAEGTVVQKRGPAWNRPEAVDAPQKKDKRKKMAREGKWGGVPFLNACTGCRAKEKGGQKEVGIENRHGSSACKGTSGHGKWKKTFLKKGGKKR